MLEKPENLNNHAINLAAKGQYQEAIACIKRAITLDKNNITLWFNLGVTYRDAGKYKEAEKAFSQAITLDEYNEEILETYATTCFMGKNFSKAESLCIDGLNYNPVNSKFWNLLGVVEFNTDKKEKAAEYFETAVSINPFYLDALYNLQDTYSDLNNRTGASEIAKKIEELEKKNKQK